jgi:hypothetical protein
VAKKKGKGTSSTGPRLASGDEDYRIVSRSKEVLGSVETVASGADIVGSVIVESSNRLTAFSIRRYDLELLSRPDGEPMMKLALYDKAGVRHQFDLKPKPEFVRRILALLVAEWPEPLGAVITENVGGQTVVSERAVVVESRPGQLRRRRKKR